MKKVIVALMLMVSAVMADVVMVDPNSDAGYLITEYGGEYGVTLEKQVNDTPEIYNLLNKQKVSSSALSSVELNPDHEGLSVGVGASAYAGNSAYAVGVMYGIGNLGVNIKGYQGQGGYAGASVGATYGF